MIQNPTVCCQCAAPIPLDAPAGLCPVCLFSLARNSTEARRETVPFSSKNRQFGDYILGQQLGCGGMGIVYEARQTSRNRRVAIKLIRESHLASNTSLRRFTVEAEAVARLNHPHIVPLYEIGEQDGQPFLTMALIEGESLKDKIAQGAFAPGPAGTEKGNHWRAHQESIARLMVKIAQAVQHAHQRGVLHRDLKPANILINQQGEPFLTDFGLAKLLENQRAEHADSLTGSDEIPGTPSYMSPEQAAGTNSTKASDIYGLGAVMYALLTGRPPFSGTTPLDILKQVVEQSPPPPRTVNPLVPPDLETICLKCLEKEPFDRYYSAAAMAEDLQRWLANQTILARPASLARRTSQWIKRNPVGTALITTLFIGLAVSLVLLQWVYNLKGGAEKMRDEVLAEYARKVDGLWTNAEIKVAHLSSRELSVMFERPQVSSTPEQELTFGITTGLEPSSTAQKFEKRLHTLEQALLKETGHPVAIHLVLHKMGSRDHDLLIQGQADFMLVNAVDYLTAKEQKPAIVALACAKPVSQGVVFARANTGIQQLEQLRGKTLGLPDATLAITVQAKALLAGAGVLKTNLLACLTFKDQGPDTGQLVAGEIEPLIKVLKRELDAGVASRHLFEQYRSSKLIEIAPISVPADVYVACPRGTANHSKLLPALARALVQDLGGVPVNENTFSGLHEAMIKARHFDGETNAGQ